LDNGIEPYEIDIRTTDQRCNELAGAMLDLAERNWGRWRGDPAGGAPSFDDPTAAAAYRAMSDEIARAGEKMDGDMKAMDRILPMARFNFR
jgi:hypothetical protein